MTNDSLAASTPAGVGYRWPAEWEQHQATWLCWPHNEATWPGAFGEIPEIFADLARLIASFEPLKLVVGTPKASQQARAMLAGVENIEWIELPTNDAWIRDFGPMFLTGDGLPPAVIDWQYNAWGAKYPPFEKDAAAGAMIAELQKRVRYAGPLVLEPGGVDGNGQGVVLTTESCLLNPNRNPGADRGLLERVLRDYLGTRKVIWLEGGGVPGDDTDGHVDQLARFVAPHTIVAAYSLEADAEHASTLQRNVETLRKSADQVGEPMEVKLLFQPPPMEFQGSRLPVSYCNFYILNGGVIVPTFGDASADDAALAVMQDLFPERTVVGFPSRALSWGLGAVHCLTQQEPLASGLTSF